MAFRLIHITLIALLIYSCTSTTEIHRVPQESIFPDLTGPELIDSLRANYAPATVLNYNDARDLMFSGIFNIDGEVICIYTGDIIFIDPHSGIPRAEAHSQGWNTEHIWPQSKGASTGRARSDLHHLHPIRADVNSSRSNHPFGYLEAEEVTRWWNGNLSSFDIPEDDHSLWSKTKSGPPPAMFEVRDASKGNVARAMFYFFTVYQHKSDPKYFQVQKEALRRYHNGDHVDHFEYERTFMIGQAQDGKVNPFIVDTTLVRRAFFEKK